MGRLLLVCRLAVRDVRRRPAEAALLLLAIMAATTTLTLGLVLHGVTDEPYESTRAATAGPDVVASVRGDPILGQPGDLAALQALTNAPGVTDYSGPYPLIGVELEANGLTARDLRGENLGGAGAWAQGRDPAAAAVDQPELTQGGWVRDGGVVLEAGFADALELGVGDEITLRTRVCGLMIRDFEPPDCRVVNRRSFEVVGVAVTAAARPYPDVNFGLSFEAMDLLNGGPPGEEPAADAEAPVDPVEPGLVWLTEADARGLAPTVEGRSYVVNLKLADPNDAPAFVNDRFPTSWTAPALQSWQDIRDGHDEVVKDTARVLRTGSWLLGLLAVAGVAVLVGGRMADQTRRIGLLKAIGGTPRLVAVVLLAEYMALALLAAAVGLAAGWLAAPLLADPGAGLLGSAGAPSLTVSTVGVVTAVALGVAAVATFVPAVRAARISTVHALADAARLPRRTPWLIAISARLPVPLLLALRVAARRPRRVVLGVVSIAITVSGIYVALVLNAYLTTQPLPGGYDDAQAELLRQVLLVVMVILLSLAAVNAIFITWATVLDNRHSSALARALGATPRDVSAALTVAQVLPALAGAILGVFPGGFALFHAINAITGGDSDRATLPSLWQLLAVVLATVLGVAALTAVPARLGGRRPVTETLQAELA